MEFKQTPDSGTDAIKYLSAAKGAAEYIRTFQVEDSNGIYWSQDQSADLSLYSGASGILLFFLQLFQVTGDPSYMKDAERAGDYIVSHFQKEPFPLPVESPSPYAFLRHNECSLYLGGFSGIAFSLLNLHKYSNINTYRDTAYRLTEYVVSQAAEAEGGVYWNGYSGIFHDAGVILYLIHASEYFHEPKWLDIAAKAGCAIISNGININGDSTLYLCVQDRLGNYQTEDFTFMPNFEHGTAGISYAIAALAKATNDPRFIAAAKRGANYLIEQSVATEHGRLIPYLLPENPGNIFYLGYCNGPVGSSRPFLLLYNLTHEQKYLDMYNNLMRGMIDFGVPEQRSAGYWNNFNLCCGTAGFIGCFMDAYDTLKEECYKDLMVRSGNVLLANAQVDGQTVSWSSALVRLEPDNISNVNGYMNGNAGIGKALLHLYTFLEQKNSVQLIKLPDEVIC